MKFSVITQAFYDDELSYGDSLPSDAIEITSEQYADIFDAVNSDKYVYLLGEILTISEPRPDKYYKWNSDSNAWEMTAEALTQKAADEIIVASNNQINLISSAKDTISMWQTELLLGTISDADKASLTSWISYIKLLQSVDPTAAPDITWPTAPGS